jgi:hypothetical protein
MKHENRSAAKRSGTAEVDEFMARLDHPMKREVQALRSIFLGASPEISEGIKWNAPSFRTDEYFATFHLRPREIVQLILHLGAKIKDSNGPGREIADPANLLEWLAKDMCTVKFRVKGEIEAKKEAFQAIVREWIAFPSTDRR